MFFCVGYCYITFIFTGKVSHIIIRVDAISLLIFFVVSVLPQCYICKCMLYIMPARGLHVYHVLLFLCCLFTTLATVTIRKGMYNP